MVPGKSSSKAKKNKSDKAEESEVDTEAEKGMTVSLSEAALKELEIARAAEDDAKRPGISLKPSDSISAMSPETDLANTILLGILREFNQKVNPPITPEGYQPFNPRQSTLKTLDMFQASEAAIAFDAHPLQALNDTAA